MKQAARAISILLHPIFMPLVTLWLALRVDPHMGFFLPPGTCVLLLGMVAAMTIAFPLFSTLLLIHAGVLDDLHMRDHRQRTAPYAMTLLYHAMGYYLLHQAPAQQALLPLFTGGLAALLLTLLINLRWKISAHMVGIGGLLGGITALAVLHGLPLVPLLALLVLLAGALGSARLLDGGHTLWQVHAGAALGFICTHTTTLLGWSI